MCVLFPMEGHILHGHEAEAMSYMCIGYTYVPYGAPIRQERYGMGWAICPLCLPAPRPIWAICALYTLPPRRTHIAHN
jgi:hypothetical protein